MAGYRVLDLETVVDLSVWTPPAPRWLLTPGDLSKDVYGTLSSNSAPAAVIPEPAPFAPPQAHRIVAASWVNLSDDDDSFYHFAGVESLCEWNTAEDPDGPERRIIVELVREQDKDRAAIVSWNGRSFDLPVLNLRALKHKIPMGWYYQQDGMRYRFSDAGHCDLMDYLGDYGAAKNMKLDDVCHLIGLPGKVGEVTGSSIAETVAKGDDPKTMELVARYCAGDAIQTALAFLRSRFHREMITPMEHDKAVDSFDCDEVNELISIDWSKLKVVEQL